MSDTMQEPKTLEEVLALNMPIDRDHVRDAGAIKQSIQQEQETTLKQGFYAGQANAGVKLEQAHKNWDKWNFGKGGKDE